MSTELRNSIIYANKMVSKYLKFFFLEVSAATVLDLLAVYAAISRLVVVLDYFSFLLPALPIVTSLIHGMNRGRSVWWWVNEGYTNYMTVLPLKTREFVFLNAIFSLVYEYYPSAIPYYAAMLIVGMSIEKIVYIFLGSTALFLLMTGFGSLIASLIGDWFKIAALTSLIQWFLFAFTPTLYALDYLARISQPLYYLVASNPVTFLVQGARSAATLSEALYMVPLLFAALIVLYGVCEIMARTWRR